MPIECTKCKTMNPDGSIVCSECMEPLDPPSGSKKATASKSPSPPAASATVPALRFSVLEAGVPGDKGFDVPQGDGDFEMSLGRPDLSSTPPVVPDVDLSRMTEMAKGKNDKGKEKVGWHISRQQATMSRRSGKLFIKNISKGSKTIFRKAGDDWKEVASGKEVEVNAGDEVGFGSSSNMLLMRLAEK